MFFSDIFVENVHQCETSNKSCIKNIPMVNKSNYGQENILNASLLNCLSCKPIQSVSNKAITGFNNDLL